MLYLIFKYNKAPSLNKRNPNFVLFSVLILKFA